MELPPQLADLQPAQLAPVSHLAPYLSQLDLADAVESFARLADSLSAPVQAPYAESADFASSPSSASSPVSSEQTSCPNSNCACYFSSGSSSSSNSSGTSKSRQRSNANAAGRYRQRVKGRASCLAEQELRERQRNRRLRRQLERKLEVYTEFVQLLAANTADSDGRLAALAANSIQGVLADVIGAPGEQPTLDSQTSEDDRCVEEVRAQLAGQLTRFARISSWPTGCGQQQRLRAAQTTYLLG